jgi:hypothetical protein
LQKEIAATSDSGPTHQIKEKSVESLIFLGMNSAQKITRQVGFHEKRKEEGIARMGQTSILY